MAFDLDQLDSSLFKSKISEDQALIEPVVVGDAVRLVGSGQAMAVIGVGSVGLQVIWLDKNHQVQRDSFPKAVLRRSGDIVRIEWMR